MSRKGLGPRRDTGSLCLASTCTDSGVVIVTTPQTQWDPGLLLDPIL